MAVNHDGDSDTTGSLVGQLLGAMHGESAIPEHWLRDLEGREVISRIADDLHDFPQWSLADDSEAQQAGERYPGW